MRRSKWNGGPSDQALMRARLAGLSDSEIARQFGLARSTVWKRFRAMEETMRAEADIPQTTVVSTRQGRR